MIETALNYKDVYLVPQKTIVNSRKECNTSAVFGPFVFDMPVYPANMKSVVDLNTCKFLAKNGFFYTMHRFNISAVDVIKFAKDNDIFSSISIGVNEDTYEDLKIVKNEGYYPDYITLDVANAWCAKAEKMVEFVHHNFPNSFLIVGNVATQMAVDEIQKWEGVDSIKVGIAGGAACTTKNKTGFHVPMITSVLECCQVAKVPIVADGGIVEHGDIAKAIACGAEMVMAGSLFAGYDQSAGEVVEIDGRHYKEYFGSASQFNKGEYKNVEGKKILVEYKGNMEKLLVELKEDLQSSISYAGGEKLSDLYGCEMIRI